MNFEICHLEDILSISSHDAVLPKFQLDLPFFNDHDTYSCNDSNINHETPSIFDLTAQTTVQNYTSVPVPFLMILCMEFLFLSSLLVIALWPSILSLYNHLRLHLTTGYTLTFVGLKLPKGHSISTHWMFPRIDTTKTIHTVTTKLQSHDTIGDLKSTVKSVYSIPNSMDILVVFAHHIISNDALTLDECGIADRSLLTLALCPSGKVVEEQSHFKGYIQEVAVSVIRSMGSDDGDHFEFDPRIINDVFEMNSDDESSDDSDGDDDEEDSGNISLHEDESTNSTNSTNSENEEKEDPNAPRMGFDVVMQEDNVTVYKMPKCGHEMNPESLYHYALSQYAEKSNLTVTCPHFWCEFPCKQQWDYHDILSVLRRDGGDYDYYKMELLASRNRVQHSCNVQKCPKCDTLYYQNECDAANLGEIDTAEAVEKAFKSQCVFCTMECRTWKPVYEPVEVEVGPLEVPTTFERNSHRRRNAMVMNRPLLLQHIEDDVEELVDGNAVNAMFGHYESDTDTEDESESESESESDDEEEEMEIIHRTNLLFADDDEEDGPETAMNAIYRLFNSTMSTITGTLISAKDIIIRMIKAIVTGTYHSIPTSYRYLTTKSMLEMDEDLNSLMTRSHEFIKSQFQKKQTVKHEEKSGGNNIEIGTETKSKTETDSEWIDGHAINAMFGMFEDEEDSDYDSDEEAERDIIARTNALFDDDDDEDTDKSTLFRFISMKTMNTMKIRDSILSLREFTKSMTTAMITAYQHITTEVMKEVDSVHDFQSVVHGMYIVIKRCMAALKRDDEDEEEDVVEPPKIELPTRRRHRTRRRRVNDETMDLYDGGLFGTFSDDSSDDEEEENGALLYDEDEEYFEYIEQSDYDSVDSDTMEERVIASRISLIFEGDGISDVEEDEDENEGKEVYDYQPVMKLHDAFCWGCGVTWEEGHVCDSSFKRDLCEILQMAETKTIGEQTNVPSIRCCPTCSQLITHTQACKHMDCRNCRKSFCFVCLRLRDPKKGWQCGSYSSRCPGGVAPRQGMDSLPDAIVITKNAFHLY